ncbi:5707_t:CDS:2, partial [Gigaspora rosea]
VAISTPMLAIFIVLTFKINGRIDFKSEMPTGKIRTYCLALLILQLFILTFLCPAL